MTGRTPRRILSQSRRPVVFAGAALALVLVLGCIFHAEGAFFALGTHTDALWWLAGFGVLACGMTVVIVSGGIDLSVGSTVALVGVVFAALVVQRDLAGWQAIPIAIAVGGAVGVASGLLVGSCGLQAFIATLAMMAFARGLAKYLCQWLVEGSKIRPQGAVAPPAMESMNAYITVGDARLAVGVFIWLGCSLLTLFLLRCTSFGLRVYAVGDNEEAARVAGLPVRLTKTLVYAYCGAMAGISGVMFAGMLRQGDPDSGVGYELTAIAMVVIGGTSLSGGRGGVMLSVLGALTIGYLKKILDLNSIETPMQLMITGAIIVAAALIRGVPGRRRGA